MQLTYACNVLHAACCAGSSACSHRGGARRWYSMTSTTSSGSTTSLSRLRRCAASSTSRRSSKCAKQSHVSFDELRVQATIACSTAPVAWRPLAIAGCSAPCSCCCGGAAVRPQCGCSRSTRRSLGAVRKHCAAHCALRCAALRRESESVNRCSGCGPTVGHVHSRFSAHRLTGCAGGWVVGASVGQHAARCRRDRSELQRPHPPGPFSAAHPQCNDSSEEGDDRSPLSVVCCMMPVVCCMMYVACCML